MQQLYEALLKGFTAGKDFVIGQWTPQEMARARELAETRYITKEWNWMR